MNAAVAAVFFEQHYTLYRQAGNPIHVWRAYVLARNVRVPMPDWVLDYLDKAAKVLAAPKGNDRRWRSDCWWLHFGDTWQPFGGDRVTNCADFGEISMRRDGRVVDGGGLENHCTGNGAGGSNPSPSASYTIQVVYIQ